MKEITSNNSIIAQIYQYLITNKLQHMTKLKSFLFLATLMFLGMQLAAQSHKANDILGHWFNEEKDAKVEIYQENGKYYGKVVWLEEPNEPDTGLPKLDDEIDDP